MKPIKGEDALETVEQLRDFLDDHSPVGAAALINDGLRRSRATPALRHDHDRWWTEVTSDTDRCSAHLAATTLTALAAVVATLGSDLDQARPATVDGVPRSCAREPLRATTVGGKWGSPDESTRHRVQR